MDDRSKQSVPPRGDSPSRTRQRFSQPKTQATVGGSPFGPFISVARGHSRE